MGGTEYVSFELYLGILRGPGEGRGGAPGTVPLQNPEVTSRKACLRNADLAGDDRGLTYSNRVVQIRSWVWSSLTACAIQATTVYLLG